MATTPLVLDTGPFVALIHRGDRHHAVCSGAYRAWDGGRIVTTETVVTETMYLLAPSWPAQQLCLEFILRGAVVLVHTTRDTLRRIQTLMERYKDLPMDYADATLVALAEDLRTEQVFTLDRRGFSVYRLHGTVPFSMIP